MSTAKPSQQQNRCVRSPSRKTPLNNACMWWSIHGWHSREEFCSRVASPINFMYAPPPPPKRFISSGGGGGGGEELVIVPTNSKEITLFLLGSWECFYTQASSCELLLQGMYTHRERPQCNPVWIRVSGTNVLQYLIILGLRWLKSEKQHHAKLLHLENSKQ